MAGINPENKKVNKLVIPVSTPDKTIRIFVPGKEKVENILENKSSIRRMIDDFHRNLPPAGVTEEDSVGLTVGEKTGTVVSRASFWSVRSSSVSADPSSTLNNPSKTKGTTSSKGEVINSKV